MQCMPCSLPGLLRKGGHLHRVVPTMSAGLWDCTFDQVRVRLRLGWIVWQNVQFVWVRERELFTNE